MRTYLIFNRDGGSFGIIKAGFCIMEARTSDRRLARRCVRMARRLGYRGVYFKAL